MGYVTLVAGTTITSSWANANVRDQGVTPFADSTARSAAISSPIEGMVTYLTGVNRFDFYNGSAWQPVAAVAGKVTRSGNMIIPTGTVTPVEWQVEAYDDYGMWAGGNPTRLSAPWTGWYAASTTIAWESSSNGVLRRTGLYLNGTVEDQTGDQLDNVVDAQPLRQNCSAIGVKMTAGQYFEVQVAHDAGANRNIETSVTNFKLTYLGPAT